MNMILLIYAFVFLLTLPNSLSQNEYVKLLSDQPVVQGCWLKAYGRGLGNAITTCKADLEKSGLLCYPKCNSGYKGVGPVCWQDCPNNFRDDGAFCYKPSPYGRGVGYSLWNLGKCEKENSQGCEKNGLLYYPKCKENFYNVGCCVCSPNCPKGMTDIGISCSKDTYGRGWGSPLGCTSEQEYDAGLCYPPCESTWKGVGPVCWGGCPNGYNKCGALCLKNQECADQIKTYMKEVISIVEAIAIGNPIKTIIDIGKLGMDLTFPICSQ